MHTCQQGTLSGIAEKFDRIRTESGPFGIAIDPVRTETAKLCDMWAPIRPGTDCALALALIHVIIDRGWHDREFVESWTVGFERLREHTRDFTPAWSENVTGVPARVKGLLCAIEKIEQG